MGLRASVRQMLTSVGLGSVVERYHAYVRAKVPYIIQRDRQDMRQIALLLRFVLRPDSNCVDIGANEGAVLRVIATSAPEGRHIAFEPIPHLAARLRDDFASVDVREVALADQRGDAEFVHVVDCEAMSGLHRQQYPFPNWRTETITVAVDRLDGCLPNGYVPDLLKIDVEGAERAVLQGGIQTIRRHRPLIIFEHGKNGAGYQGYGPEAIWPLLEDYEVFDIDGNGPYTLPRMIEVFDEARVWTWIARRAPRCH
jgi:FkbM family methyltransferase